MTFTTLPSPSYIPCRAPLSLLHKRNNRRQNRRRQTRHLVRQSSLQRILSSVTGISHRSTNAVPSLIVRKFDTPLNDRRGRTKGIFEYFVSASSSSLFFLLFLALPGRRFRPFPRPRDQTGTWPSVQTGHLRLWDRLVSQKENHHLSSGALN
jgi:hypothetical protein